jgi:hypothetical protein
MFKRRRLQEEVELKQRLKADALRMRDQAKLLPPGAVRDAVLRKAQQMEAASGRNGFPRLQPLNQGGKHADEFEDICDCNIGFRVRYVALLQLV